MIDAVGEPQSVLVLGGSSEIALATVEALPRTRLRRVVLAGRPSAEIDRAAAHLGALGIPSVETTLFDAADTGSHGAFVDGVFDDGDVDIVLLCFGVLGDQAEAEADPTKAVEVATAGDRARRSNYVYGSTKAGLDAFAQGLGDALVGSGASVLIVRPGMVRTRMSDGLPEAPMTTDPEVVGSAIVQALRKGKSVIYVPGPLRFLMTAVKAVPRPLFRRLPQ